MSIKINLEETLKDFNNKKVSAMQITDQAGKLYQKVLSQIKKYGSDSKINNLFLAIKGLLKDKFQPFIFQKDLEVIINNALNDPIESINKRELLQFILSEKGKDIEEFQIINNLKKVLHSEETILEIKRKKDIQFIIDRLVDSKSINPDALNIFTCELIEKMDNNFS